MSQIMILLYHCLPICIVPISPIMYSNKLYFPKLLYTALYPCPFCLQYLFWLFCIIIGHPSWMPSILTRFYSLYSCIFNPLRFHAHYFILSFFNCPVKNVEHVKLIKGDFVESPLIKGGGCSSKLTHPFIPSPHFREDMFLEGNHTRLKFLYIRIMLSAAT